MRYRRKPPHDFQQAEALRATNASCLTMTLSPFSSSRPAARLHEELEVARPKSRDRPAPSSDGEAHRCAPTSFRPHAHNTRRDGAQSRWPAARWSFRMYEVDAMTRHNLNAIDTHNACMRKERITLTLCSPRYAEALVFGKLMGQTPKTNNSHSHICRQQDMTPGPSQAFNLTRVDPHRYLATTHKQIVVARRRRAHGLIMGALTQHRATTYVDDLLRQL